MKISWPWKCSFDKHPAYCWDWHDDDVVVVQEKTLLQPLTLFRISAPLRNSVMSVSHLREEKTILVKCILFFQHEKRDFVSSEEPF